MSTATGTEIGSLLVVREGYRQGRPCLRGTGLTVHNVAAGYLKGHTVEELCAANPDLDPALFYAALAYFFANREGVEADIAADAARGEALSRRFPRTRRA